MKKVFEVIRVGASYPNPKFLPQGHAVDHEAHAKFDAAKHLAKEIMDNVEDLPIEVRRVEVDDTVTLYYTLRLIDLGEYARLKAIEAVPSMMWYPGIRAGERSE